ncbi:MAG: VCBS repeat-containing protein, partial [Actinobacteria bacterium]|nr:VCBS repeat-containing protein [Actinomycetota bacterium]
DGKTDFAVYRPATGAWYVNGADSASWGAEGDIPVPGDYNGDGKTDFAVYRPTTGAWYVNGADSASWGAPGDVALSLPYAIDRSF